MAAMAVLALVLALLVAAILGWRLRQARIRLQEAQCQGDAVRRQLDALRRVLAAARVGVWQADARGVLAAADDVARDLWRRPEAALPGACRLTDLRAPQHREGVGQRLQAALQRREPLVRMPNQIQRGNGDRLWVSTTAVPLLDDDGRVSGLLGCDVDIDARQRLLLALQAAERRYRLLAEHTQSIIYTIDNAGRLTYVSPSWTLLLGHPVEEVIGRDFRPFVHPEDVPLCEDFLARTLRERRVLPPLTYRVLHRDGRVRYHRSMLAPVLDDDG
ncbi:MAG: PAS domain S-box protein, partial [Tepidimonas fonticaldi]|nr:PAS domain S-box protein [Tepidimonas fonticaldi]